MKEVKWTDEQRIAINFNEGSAVVSAAAGSGKTAVLVERVITLLMNKEKPVRADKLAVATFTEKAANELKTRLNAALVAAVEKNPDDEYLKEQLLCLEDASISTISSFCMKILRNNSAAAGLSPDFSVIDEAEGKLQFKKALDSVLEDFYESQRDEDKNLLFDWYGNENDNELCQNITYICDFLKKLPYKEKSLAKWLEIYDNPEESAEKTAAERVEKIIKPLILRMSALVPVVDSGDEPGKKFTDKWKAVIESLKLAAGISPDSEGRLMLKDALELKAPSIAPNRKPSKNSEGYDNSHLVDGHEALKEIFAQVITEAGYLASLAENLRESAPVLRLLLELAEETENRYRSYKQSKNKIDFSDAEILTLQILQDEKNASEIRSNYSVIIVDEFQDSNDMQYEIFNALSENGKNLFFVGDIKQSIYRFRGANPRVFSRILDDPRFTNIYLNRNFRSNKAVIDSVNAIFDEVMTKELGEVDYDDTAKLVQGRDKAEYETRDEYRTELVYVYGDKKEDARKKEAAYIADRIRKMVEEGFEVPDKNGVLRPCRYGDFAILMGKYRASAFHYKNSLSNAGIPYNANEDCAFTDFFEIKLLLSLLRIIDNPYCSKELAAILTLPPYSLTHEELAAAKLCGGKKHKTLYTGIREYAKENEKAAHFCNELNALREFASEHSVEQLIRRIYDESDVVTAVLAMPDGDKRNSNVKLLISYAQRFSENGVKGLYDFLSYMETIRRSDIRMAQAQSAAAEENSVKIMTIHGSKGLEFPICIVANLSSEYRFRGLGKIIADIDKGIGLRVVQKDKNIILNSFLYSSIKDECVAQELSEQMRLLYVAATRAREKLIFTAPISSSREPQVHLAWLEQSRAVREGLVVTRHVENFTPGAMDKTVGTEKKTVELKPFASYAYEKYSHIPSKVTATQVGVKSVDDFAAQKSGVDRFLKMPEFVKNGETGRLSGKKKGDAYHKAMELMDFNGDVSQLDELLERGKLTPAERSCINDAEIKAFLDSELCRRINAGSKVHKEFPIFCEYCPEDFPDDEEKPFVQGIADLYFVKDGKIVLVDYKTNVNTTPELLREEYEGQLHIYSEALKKMTGLEVKECCLWAFTLGSAVQI